MSGSEAGEISRLIARSWLVDFALARTLPYLSLPLLYVIYTLAAFGSGVFSAVMPGSASPSEPWPGSWIQLCGAIMPMLLRLLSVAVASSLLPARLGAARRTAGLGLAIFIVLGELPRLLFPHRFPWWIPLFTAFLPFSRRHLLPDVVLQHDIWPLAAVLALVLPTCLLVAGRPLAAPVPRSGGFRSGKGRPEAT